jgi:hypothetical protein
MRLIGRPWKRTSVNCVGSTKVPSSTSCAFVQTLIGFPNIASSDWLVGEPEVLILSMSPFISSGEMPSSRECGKVDINSYLFTRPIISLVAVLAG